MCAELLQLLADIFVDVLEGAEKGARNHGGAGAILNPGAQVLFARLHQSAILGGFSLLVCAAVPMIDRDEPAPRA